MQFISLAGVAFIVVTAGVSRMTPVRSKPLVAGRDKTWGVSATWVR